MPIAEIATVVIAVVALITGGLGTIAWFYRRGQSEQKLASSMDRLTESGDRQAVATEALSGQMGSLGKTIEHHSETLVEHHWRLRALEDGNRIKVLEDREGRTLHDTTAGP